MLSAWNDKNWNKVQSMVYNTVPVEMPSNWFEQKSAGSNFAKLSYTIGKPYIIDNWTTPKKSFITDLEKNISQEYSIRFSQAVTVPVTFVGDDHITHYHVVNVNGEWKIAYSRLNGFEIWDNASDLIDAVKKESK